MNMKENQAHQAAKPGLRRLQRPLQREVRHMGERNKPFTQKILIFGLSLGVWSCAWWRSLEKKMYGEKYAGSERPGPVPLQSVSCPPEAIVSNFPSSLSLLVWLHALNSSRSFYPWYELIMLVIFDFSRKMMRIHVLKLRLFALNFIWEPWWRHCHSCCEDA